MIPLRAAILETVRAAPGIHKSGLCRAMGLSWGNASHHLGAMLREGTLEGVREGRRTRLFPPGLRGDEQRVHALLRDAKAAQVLEAVRRRPGIQVDGLVAALPASRRVVAHRLAELLDAGLVRAEGRRGRRYYPEAP